MIHIGTHRIDQHITSLEGLSDTGRVGIINLNVSGFRVGRVLGRMSREYMNSGDKVVSKKDGQYLVSKISGRADKTDDHHTSNVDVEEYGRSDFMYLVRGFALPRLELRSQSPVGLM
jgi:hypothetical protein